MLEETVWSQTKFGRLVDFSREICGRMHLPQTMLVVPASEQRAPVGRSGRERALPWIDYADAERCVLKNAKSSALI